MKTCTPLTPKLNEFLIRFQSMTNTIVEDVTLDAKSREEVRVDVAEIESSDVLKTVRNLSLAEGIGEIAPRIKQRISRSLNIAAQNSKTVEAMVDLLSGSTDNSGSKEFRNNALALELVIDTIRGEVNKAENNDIELSRISNTAGIPFVPAHRLAATIGRKALYAEGVRLTVATEEYTDKNGNTKTRKRTDVTPEQVEHAYFMKGMAILADLEDKGVITLHKKGKVDTINDVIKEGSNKRHYGEDVIRSDFEAVEINADILGAKDTGNNTQDPVVRYLRNEKIDIRQDSPQLYSSMHALKAANYLTVPQRLSLPGINQQKEERVKGDDYTPDKTLEKARKEFEGKPLKVSPPFMELMQSIAKKVKNGEMSASEFISSAIGGDSVMNTLFRVDRQNDFASNKESHSGRNRSSTTPIDDFVEYLDTITEETDNPDIYLQMFFGRNARGYYENSVMNPHASKLMRNAMTVATYEIDVDEKPEVLDFFVAKVADALKKSGSEESLLIDSILEPNESPESKALEKALTEYEAFKSADNAKRKLSHLNNASIALTKADMAGLNAAELIATLEAVTDAREASGTGRLVSQFAAASDATASGGMLTLLQAVGANPDKIKQLLVNMGVLKGKKTKQVDDIYKVLTDKMEEVIKNGSLLQESIDNPVDVKMLQSIQNVIYKGNLRELSKGPTMTFIYRQSKTGGVKSMSKDMADRLISKIKGDPKKVDKATLELLTDLGVIKEAKSSELAALQKDTAGVNNLRHAIEATGVPEVLFDALTESLVDEYLDEYVDLSKRVFAAINNEAMTNMKILPASAYMEWRKDHGDAEPTASYIDKHGIRLTKRFAVSHEVDGDTVLTFKEFLRDTVMNVSTVHGIDTALLYRSTAGLPNKYDSGAIFVHDEIRSRPDMVMEIEQNYVANTKEISEQYDIFEQVLIAAKAFDPDGQAKYTNLLNEVQQNKKVKQQVLGDADGGFDLETGSIIGDRVTVAGVGQRDSAKSNQGKTNSKKTSKPKQKRSASSQKSAEGILKVLSSKSEIIEGFLNSKGASFLQVGDTFSFDSNSDIINVRDDTLKDLDKMVEKVEHEILHSYSTGLITGWAKGKIKSVEASYIDKALNKLEDLYYHSDAKLPDRLDYILMQPDRVSRMSEFVSIMNTEPAVAEQVYNALNAGEKKDLTTMLLRLWNKVIKSVTRPTENDLIAENIDPELLQSSLAAIVEDGKSMREENAKAYRELQEAFGETLNYERDFIRTGPVRPAEIPVNGAISLLNNAIVQHLNDPALGLTKKWTGNLDDILRVKFPAYRRLVQRTKKIYGKSEGLQSLVHKITNDGINNEKKNKVLSMFSAIKADSQEILSNELNRLKQLTKGLSDEEMAGYYDFTMKMSLADAFKHSLHKVSDIEAEIESVVKAGRFSADQQAKLDSIVDLNVNGKVTSSTVYNVHAAGFNQRTDELARKYVALKSIEQLGADRFKAFAGNTELFTAAVDILAANENIIEQAGNLDTLRMRDNGVVEEFDGNPEFRVIRASELNRYDNPDKTEWKVLRKPGKGTYGIVYRKTIDSTYQEGTYTTISTRESDIKLQGAPGKTKGAVKVAKDDYRLVLTEAEKDVVGRIKDPSQSLVRTMAHNLEIKDSNDIRDMLLEQDTHHDLRYNGEDRLVDIIKDKDRDNPWLLSAKADQDYDSLHPAIKSRYMRLPVSLSNVGGFGKDIKYVRKDIAYWLVGSSEPSFVNNKQFQWAVRVTKNLVSGTKIGMVVLNPMKIAIDNVSNISYLTVMGVDPIHIQKEYRNVLSEFNSYKKLRNELNITRMRAYTDPKQEAKVKELEAKLKAHPGNGFVERGFINSLGSELVMQADDPSSGFKKDVDFVLRKIFTEKSERNNRIANFIMKASNYGPGVEEVLESFSKFFGAVDSGKEMERSLNEMAERIRDIKSEDDIVDYLHQYINSPNSEFVKLGTHMTDLSDVTAKETYYRYLVKNGVDPKKAELEVIDSFPDYKEGMPTKVKQLSDMGILMFPSYWIRIQKAIYRMVKNKPVSFGTEMAIQDMLSINSHNIFDQNIINKANSFFGLVHAPWDHIGVGSILPTRVF